MQKLFIGLFETEFNVIHHGFESKRIQRVKHPIVVHPPCSSTGLKQDIINFGTKNYFICSTSLIVVIGICGVYSWGSNFFGKLGIGDRKSEFKSHPCHIKSLVGIVKIACGMERIG